MRPKIFTAICIILFAAGICGCIKDSDRSGVTDELALLDYKPIDFRSLLTKPVVTYVRTDKDPFKSPIPELGDPDNEEKRDIAGLASESLRLTGIIKSATGSVALIRPESTGQSRAVRINSMIGRFLVTDITDKEVILDLNGQRAVLQLGGGQDVSEKR